MTIRNANIIGIVFFNFTRWNFCVVVARLGRSKYFSKFMTLHKMFAALSDKLFNFALFKRNDGKWEFLNNIQYSTIFFDNMILTIFFSSKFTIRFSETPYNHFCFTIMIMLVLLRWPKSPVYTNLHKSILRTIFWSIWCLGLFYFSHTNLGLSKIYILLKKLFWKYFIWPNSELYKKKP